MEGEAMTPAERAQVEALIESILTTGVSPGFLRLAALVNKATKPAEVDKALLDPTETHDTKA